MPAASSSMSPSLSGYADGAKSLLNASSSCCTLPPVVMLNGTLPAAIVVAFGWTWNSLSVTAIGDAANAPVNAAGAWVATDLCFASSMARDPKPIATMLNATAMTDTTTMDMDQASRRALRCSNRASRSRNCCQVGDAENSSGTRTVGCSSTSGLSVLVVIVMSTNVTSHRSLAQGLWSSCPGASGAAKAERSGSQRNSTTEHHRTEWAARQTHRATRRPEMNSGRIWTKWSRLATGEAPTSRWALAP